MTGKAKSGKALGWLLVGIPIFLGCALFSGVLGTLMGAYLAFSSDLPKIPDLMAYKPRTVSVFYAEDNSVIGYFYKEKRFPIPLETIPPNVVNAFLAAEDARFFSHTGIDIFGIVRAVVKNFAYGNFAQGGSTITQQVTRNFLLSKEKKISRKIREAILANRLEQTLTKERILELYLNEIYMGRGAYGIESAARTYFGKPTQELTIAEAAQLAGLVANPTKFSPTKNPEGAARRKEFVLSSMLKNGFINEIQFQDALTEPLNLSENKPNPYERVPYFTETVRQYIVQKYGENKLYNDGLQVWTTCDVRLQTTASEALYKGALAWEKRQGRPAGLLKRLKSAELKEFLANQPDENYRVGDYVQAVVISNNSQQENKKGKPKQENPVQDCTLAMQGNRVFRMELMSPIRFRPNDLLEFKIVDLNGKQLILEHNSMPPVQGAVVSIENNTGYIRTLVGGLDFEKSHFNRAVQAVRQPGSAFKPLIFAAALELGSYSPNTIVLDDPIAVLMGRNEEWMPTNSDGSFLGPLTVRQALAQSRNIVAVKLLMDITPENAAQFSRNLGINSHMGKHLSMALGASEVTPLELTAAYTVFPNLGVRPKPVFVKKVVDRFGNVLEDNTTNVINPAERMYRDTVQNYPDAQPKTPQPLITTFGQDRTDSIDEYDVDENGFQQQDPMLRKPVLSAVKAESLVGDTPRVLSPQTSYLMLSMMRDVCVSGTGAAVNKLKRKDLVGKTGTTDDCSDAWFVGSSGKYTTGVWVGHDTKTSLGKGEHGATAALPIWMDVMASAHVNIPVTIFPVPNGIVFLDTTVYSGRFKQEALLEAGPDLAPSQELKQISPIDMVYLPSSGQVDPYTGMPTMISTGGQSDSVRVLTQTGETLGYGYYSRDPRGKPVVYPLQPTHHDAYRQAYDQAYGHPQGYAGWGSHLGGPSDMRYRGY